MVVLDVRLDNFYAFKNFHINFTYPKKIVGSYLEGEYLPERSNFRYKKVNILFGANASGKTTFGRILMMIFNFISKKNYNHITEAICDRNENAEFVVDFASENNVFYRVKCIITPMQESEYNSENIKIQVIRTYIRSRDSYELCIGRIEKEEFCPAQNYIEELEKMDQLAWFFEYPNEGGQTLNLPDKNEKFRFVLENILRALDPHIREVKISKEVKNTYVVYLRDKAVVLQNGSKLDTNLLSSGTKAGVEIANMIFSIMQGKNIFYYCDEKFSYIHSDIEKAMLALMIDYIGSGEQLFFTTHNTDILDMNLPKHTFSFLRKDIFNTECPITYVDASSFLKRNTDSSRSAVENALFSAAPALEHIIDIKKMNKEW